MKMEIEEQDDCIVDAVTPVKKKMKQAKLPFQMQTSAQSPNVESKKRKLRSSSQSNSPKVTKILKKSSSEDVSSEPDRAAVDTKEDSDVIELVEDAESENMKENTISSKTEVKSSNETPKHKSVKQKKSDKQEKVKTISLSKFLIKVDEQEDTAKNDSKDTLQKKKLVENTSIEDKETDSETILSQQENSKNNETNDSLSAKNDSDVVPLSSEDEDENDQMKTPATSEDDTASTPTRTPKTEKLKQKSLTPKQIAKKLLSAKKKEEREKLRQEKEKKLEEERQNRLKEKEAKRKEKEEKEKAEKEQRMIEKKMKEQKKLLETEQRQREKQAKEEERKKREEAKEEERRKKEEERLEAERKKQRAASNFTSFFVAKKQEKSAENENTTETNIFMPFEVKADMKIAPVCRRTLDKQGKLSLAEKCKQGKTKISDLYLSEIRDKKIVPRRSSKTWPLEAKDDVIILEEEDDTSSKIVKQNVAIEKQRSKLLQFCENQRPPYWGTWRKRSEHINSRKPFSKDTKWFNYEVDSDDEWEEEEPGESLHGSDDEKEEEDTEGNDYDVDNEFMVPHGYLSDEELRADGEEEEMSPETQKVKLKALGEQFESERKSKTSRLEPKIIGCVWRGSDNEFPSNVPRRIIDTLSKYEVWVHQIPIALPTSTKNEDAIVNECGTPTQGLLSAKKKLILNEAVPDLIRLIHGNRHGSQFLVKEFHNYWSKRGDESSISKSSLSKKIREIAKWNACPDEGPMYQKMCWYVPEETRKKYLSEELSLPNSWSYTLVPKQKRSFPSVDEKTEKEEKDKERRSAPLITQFTQKITQEEMKKQLTVKPAPAKPPKRVTLISVPRGEKIPETTKDSLLKNVSKRTESDSNVEILDSPDKKKKEDEDRPGIVSKECDEGESSKYVEENKDETVKSVDSTKDVRNKNVKGTVDTPMDIDSDN